MFFNPIFINPQNFMGPAGTENYKKNKLSYLFSDIIKNSLGNYSNENKSVKTTPVIETLSLGKSKSGANLISIPVNDVIPTMTSEVNSVETIFLGMKNLIENAITDITNSSDSSKSSTGDINDIDRRNIINGDKLNEFLEKLISYLNNTGYKIDIQDSEFQSNNKLMSGNSFQNELVNMVHAIESLIKSGKELTFNFSMEDKTLSIITLSNTKKSDEAQQPALIKILESENSNAKKKDNVSPPNLKFDSNSKRTSSAIDKTIPKDQIPIKKEFKSSNEIPSENKIPQNLLGIEKSKISLLKISLDMQTNKLADKIDITKNVGSSDKIILHIDNELLQAKIKEFEAKDAGNGQNKISGSHSTKIVQGIKNIENQLLKQESFAGKIKFDETTLKEIKNQNFDLLNLGSKFQRTKDIVKVFQNIKSQNVSGPKPISNSNSSSNVITNEILQTLTNKTPNDILQTLTNKTPNEIKLTTNDLSKILKVNKTREASKIKQFIKDIKGKNVKIKFYSETDSGKSQDKKISHTTKPEAAKNAPVKTNNQKTTTKVFEHPVQRTRIEKNSSEHFKKNNFEKSNTRPIRESTHKSLKLDFEQFKSAIKMNVLSKTLRPLVKNFEKVPDVKVELKSEQVSKTINENKTKLDKPVQIESQRISESKFSNEELKNNLNQKVNNKPEVKESVEKTGKKALNNNKYHADEINKKPHSTIKTIDINTSKENQNTEKLIRDNDIVAKQPQRNEVEEPVQKQMSPTEKETGKISQNKKSMVKPNMGKLNNSQNTEKKSAAIKTPIINMKTETDSEKIKLQSNPVSEIQESKIINTLKADSLDNKNGLSASENNKAGNFKSNLGDGNSESSTMNSRQNNTEANPGNNNSKFQTGNLPEDEIVIQKPSIVGQVDTNETKNIKPEISNFTKHFPQIEKTIKATELHSEISKIVNGKEKQSVMLQLVPKELGKVKILIDIIDNVIQAKIEVENVTAKMLVQNNMEQLRQSLSQSGIQLNTYSISLANQQDKNLRSHNAKKKFADREKINNEEESKPVSGKALGYNTYEYLI